MAGPSLALRTGAFFVGAALGYAGELLWRAARTPEGETFLLNVGPRDMFPFILPAAAAFYFYPRLLAFVWHLAGEYAEYEEERFERRVERTKNTLSILFYAALLVALLVGVMTVLMKAVKT